MPEPMRQQSNTFAATTFAGMKQAGYSIVFKQPETPAEIAQAEEPQASCPMETIDNDGE